MNAQEFVAAAERALSRASTDEYASLRAHYVAQAQSEFGTDIAREVDDSLPNEPIAMPSGQSGLPEVTRTTGRAH